MVLLLSALSTLALAQTPDTDAGARVVIPSVQEIDFDPRSVQGVLDRPNGVVVFDRRQATFHPLIRLRANFASEMGRSTDEVR